MASQEIGKVKSGSGKTYIVFWDHSSKDVYVGTYGWVGTSKESIGRASSAGDAMRRAEAAVYNR